MKMRLKEKVCLVAGLVLFMASSLMATVIFNDTFDVGASPTLGNDADDPNDAGWSLAGASVSFSLLNDGGNNVMYVTNSVYPRGVRVDLRAFTGGSANFAIANGEAVNVSLKIKRAYSTVTSLDGFKITLTDALTGAAGHYGYYFSANWGDSTGGLLAESGNATLANGTVITNTSPTGVCDIDGTDWHTINLTLQRMDNTHLKATYIFDGTTVLDGYAWEDTDPAFAYTYLVIGSMANNTDYMLDDIQLSVIPEPATIGLFGLAALGLMIARKKLRS